jgi:hypothetical protein
MEELSEHSESPRGDDAKGDVVDELMHGRPGEPLKGECDPKTNSLWPAGGRAELSRLKGTILK